MNWSGGYLGIEGGYDWGKFNATGTYTETKTVLDKYKTVDAKTKVKGCAPSNPCKDAKDSSKSDSKSSSYAGAGGEVGVYGGYLWENANGHVWGVEGDLNYKNLTGTSDSLFGKDKHSFGSVTTDVDWYGTLRAVIGKSFGRTLIYGTGGLAFGGVTSTVDGPEWLGLPQDASGTRVGWALGAGMAFAIHENILLKLEYIHVDLGDSDVFGWSKSYLKDCWTVAESKSITDSVKFDAVRVGLAFKFGAKAPAISVAD